MITWLIARPLHQETNENSIFFLSLLIGNHTDIPVQHRFFILNQICNIFESFGNSKIHLKLWHLTLEMLIQHYLEQEINVKLVFLIGPLKSFKSVSQLTSQNSQKWQHFNVKSHFISRTLRFELKFKVDGPIMMQKVSD